jgi:hypothetical protein
VEASGTKLKNMAETTFYERLEQDLQKYLPMMGQAADTIIDENVSKYPVFAVHQLDLELGIPLVIKTEDGPKWSIQASTLEEMVGKKLIQSEKVDDFRRVFKDPVDYLCLFTLSDQGAQFIFMPRA